MDVRAILLAGPASLPEESATLGGVPIALLDVLGRSILQRVADRLRNYRISEITAVIDASTAAAPLLPQSGSGLRCCAVQGSSLWEAAQRVFSGYAQNGADLVFFVRLGPYLAIDYDELIQAHLDGNARITAATGESARPLGTYVVSASRRNEAAFLLRHRLLEARTAPLPYCFTGYCNRLATAADLRRLAIDVFSGQAETTPEGTEIRPGVWLAKGARVERGARIVAPAFIGNGAKVCSAAVVTRCSTVERHAVVNLGTVLENATLLPYTSLGPGLEVVNAVVGWGRVCDLRRDLEVVTADPRLVGRAGSVPGSILAQVTTQLVNRFSFDRLRGLRKHDRPQSVEVTGEADAPWAAWAGRHSLSERSNPD
jgi:hypothetical protein